MNKEELFIGAVVVNTQVPEEFRDICTTVIDSICEEFVAIRYIHRYPTHDIIKKVPVDYFIKVWDFDWRVD